MKIYEKKTESVWDSCIRHVYILQFVCSVTTCVFSFFSVTIKFLNEAFDSIEFKIIRETKVIS